MLSLSIHESRSVSLSLRQGDNRKKMTGIMESLASVLQVIKAVNIGWALGMAMLFE